MTYKYINLKALEQILSYTPKPKKKDELLKIKVPPRASKSFYNGMRESTVYLESL